MPPLISVSNSLKVWRKILLAQFGALEATRRNYAEAAQLVFFFFFFF